jgi:hypothetical protein
MKLAAVDVDESDNGGGDYGASTFCITAYGDICASCGQRCALEWMREKIEEFSGALNKKRKSLRNVN